MKQTIYRSIFWLGYALVLISAFIPLEKDLHKITINMVIFKLHFDQVLHSVVYLMIFLYFSAGRFFGLTLFKENSLRIFIPIILFLATFSEIVQLVVPSRAFNFFDFLANVTGICFGLLVMVMIPWRKAGNI